MRNAYNPRADPWQIGAVGSDTDLPTCTFMTSTMTRRTYYSCINGLYCTPYGD